MGFFLSLSFVRFNYGNQRKKEYQCVLRTVPKQVSFFFYINWWWFKSNLEDNLERQINKPKYYLKRNLWTAISLVTKPINWGLIN